MSAEYNPLFDTLTPIYKFFDDFESITEENKPLLAHYTHLHSLEAIITSDELWFSNPLYMNDMEEMRWGMVVGTRFMLENEAIKSAMSSPEIWAEFCNQLRMRANNFDEFHALDTYVFCLSHYDQADKDGRLSMWRGYGGDASGVALVFDTSKIELKQDTPLTVAKVKYLSAERRLSEFARLAEIFCGLVKDVKISTNEDINIAAFHLFDMIRMFAIFTKHPGFAEEQEWRIAYFPEKDIEKRLFGRFGYTVKKSGVEPKLKFPLRHIEGLTAEDFSIEKILHSIVIGPTQSAPLSVKAVARMLSLVGKDVLRHRLVASNIPYRPQV